MDLRCRKTSCKYNLDLTCLAKEINISNKLVCEKFEKLRSAPEKDFSSLIFDETPPKVADYRHLKDVNLTCRAKCLFNRNCHCISNGITINAATQKEPKCMTYMKP